MADTKLLCPKCGSDQLTANKKGFSGKKAVAGELLVGPMGLLAGTLGSNKIKITCLSCGHVFKPGQGASSQQQVDENKKNDKAATKWALIILGGLLLFYGASKLFGGGDKTNSSENKEETISGSYNQSNTTAEKMEKKEQPPSKALSKEKNNAVAIKLEKLLESHFESYKTNKKVKVTMLGGGWVKERYYIDGDYNYDVQKNNSLISPYLGNCEFKLKRDYTNFHTTSDEAEADANFINSDSKTHKHYYSYTKENWVVSKRENEGYSKWYDCNEKILDGENKNSTNIHGCWEENF